MIIPRAIAQTINNFSVSVHVKSRDTNSCVICIPTMYPKKHTQISSDSHTHTRIHMIACIVKVGRSVGRTVILWPKNWIIFHLCAAYIFPLYLCLFSCISFTFFRNEDVFTFLLIIYEEYNLFKWADIGLWSHTFCPDLLWIIA